MKFLKRLFLLTAFILLGSISFVAFPQGMKIVTGHPDFKMKVTRCEESGNKVYVDLILENIGSSDCKIGIHGGLGGNSNAIDDEGNKYTNSDFLVQLGKGYPNSGEEYTVLYPEVPVKVKLIISGVPESATSFKLINLMVQCSEWNLSWHTVKLHNVPIYHEGDE